MFTIQQTKKPCRCLPQSFSASRCARLARAAARSICPGADLTAASVGRDEDTWVGLAAAGIGGFPPTLGVTLGLEPTGGVGLGLLVKGGGTLVDVVAVACELSVAALEADFFQGVAVPLAGAIPGNTETGFAEESGVIDDETTFGAGGILRGGAGGGGGGAD